MATRPEDIQLDEATLHDLDAAIDDAHDECGPASDDFEEAPTRPVIEPKRKRGSRPDTRPEDRIFVARLLERDPIAWCMLFARVERMLRCLLRRRFANALDTVWSSDTIDEI